MPSDPRLLLLDDRDNVLVVRARIRAGEAIDVEGVPVVVTDDLPLGHKLARRDIASGEKIVKYGAPIGSATATTSRRRPCPRAQRQERLHADLPPRRRPGEEPGRSMMRGYLRNDGRKGIRNTVVVAYLVECAHHVAREIAIPFRERRCPRHRLPRLLPQFLCRADDGAALHPPECRRGAPGLARLRELQQVRPRPCRPRERAAGADHRHPGGRRHPEVDRRRPGLRRRAARRARCDGDRADGRRRADRRHRLRRLGRHLGHHRQPRRRPRLRHAGRRRRRLHLRGDRRADRLRAHHGEPGDHARARPRARGERRQGGALLRDARLRLLRRRQRRGRPHHHRGEIDGRLRQVRRVADLAA